MRRGLTKYWFAIYVLAALLMLTAFLKAGLTLMPLLEDWLMARLVPEPWHSTVEDLLHRLFREELRAFLVTTGFGLGIILIGMTLFPLKEKLSATYEEERFPQLKKHDPPPLWQQGLEEVKLAMLYLLLQGLSLFLTLQGQPFLARLSTALSIAYLIAAMALDHCAPFFQRRHRKIHGIIWILLRRAPLRSALIGLLCIGPVILLESRLPSGFDPALAISVLVASEVLGMACATLLGCHLGAALLLSRPELARDPPPSGWTWSYRTAVFLLAAWMTIFFAWWGRAALTHHQILHCQYRPLWRDTGLKLRDTIAYVTLPVEVRNPSAFPIDPIDLELVILGEGVLEGNIDLDGPVIPADGRATVSLTFAAALSENALLNLPEFLEAQYSGHLRVEPPLSRAVLFQIFP